MSAAEEAKAALQAIARLTEQQAGALNRAFRMVGNGAIVGQVGTRLFNGMSERHAEVRRAFVAAFDQVERLAARDNARVGVPRPSINPPQPKVPSDSGRVGGDPDLMSTLASELGTAGRDWEEAGEAVARTLNRLGLDPSPGWAIAKAGTWVAGQKREVIKSRDELLNAAPVGLDATWAPVALFRDPTLPMAPPMLTGEDGKKAAEMVQRALDGRAGPDEFKSAMALLKTVGDHARLVQSQGGRLTDGELAFLTSFYSSLGTSVYKLPGYMRASDHKYDENGHFLWWGWEHAPGFGDADQKQMMSAVGAGILALSDEKLGGGFQGDGHPYGLPKDLYDLLYDPAVKAETRLPSMGIPTLVVVEGKRLGDLGALVDMVHSAPPDMHGGTRFSELATERVAEISNIVERNRTSDPKDSPGSGLVVDPELAHWGEDDHDLRNLLDVSTRNHEANHNILTGKTHDPMARIATYIEDPVYTMDDRKFIVSSLFGKEWSDDGATAGHLVDWIGTDATKPGETGERARQAYTDLTNLVTDDQKIQVGDGWGGKTDTNFFTMMAKDMRENGAISTALARATQPNIGMFAHPLDSGDTQWNNGNPQLSDHDASRIMMLSQYTREGRSQITIASQAYKFDLLDQVHGGKISQTAAGEFAGNIDGYATAGAENAIWEKNAKKAGEATKEAQEAYLDRVMYANVVKGFISFGVGRADVTAGPYLSQVVDRSSDLIFGTEFRGPKIIRPEQLPQDLANTPLHTAQGAANYGAYDLANYEQFRGRDIPPEATWMDEKGQVHATDAQGHARVADPLEVSNSDIKERVAEWARLHYGDYMTGYQMHANDVYIKNAHTKDEDEINNYMDGGR